jgi:D-beta-D-heptose 7-phosphate kinase/D-beta-D-heptose 1-phosphate adenosyltransferase
MFALIRQAAGSCDRLIMALNSDESVRRLKGPSRPIQDEAARAAVMGAIKGVSAVVTFGEDTPLELITALQPDVLSRARIIPRIRWSAPDRPRRGGRVLLVDLAAGHSTTRLVKAATPG